MSWGQIKKAINSTLGTENFKPLDIIFSEGIKRLKESILSGSVVCGKAKVLENDAFDLQVSETNLPQNTITVIPHQGIDNGMYVVDISLKGVWQNIVAVGQITQLMMIGASESESNSISHEWESFKFDCVITTTNIKITANPVYGALSGYDHAELVYAKLKRIY